MYPDALPRGLQLCRAYADYAQALVQSETGVSPTNPRVLQIPDELSPRMASEVQSLVGRYIEAWSNQVILPYKFDDVLDILESQVPQKDEAIRRLSSGNNQPQAVVCRPTVFLDMQGVVIAWYIPSAFQARRCEKVFESTRRLLENSKPPRVGPSKSWRFNETTYADPTRCRITPGIVTVSICWYNQAWGPHNSFPSPSVNLDRQETGAMQFLEEQVELNGLIGALLYLVHPKLFEKQFEVLEDLASESSNTATINRPVMMEAFGHWSSPFSGVSVITNRETPLHRDPSGGKELFDILAVFGEYDQGRFEAPGLRSRFLYNPGTAIVLPGGALQHGASRTDGERICLASFLRPNVGLGVLGGAYWEIGPPHRSELEGTFGLR